MRPPVPGVTLLLTRGVLTANAQTNAAGLYSFTGVRAGYNYTLAPTGSGHTFNPQSVSFAALNADQAGSFTGTPPVSITSAPGLADTYVRGGSAATWYESGMTDYVRGELSAGRRAVSFVHKSTAVTSYQMSFNSWEAAGTNVPNLVVTAR